MYRVLLEGQMKYRKTSPLIKMTYRTLVLYRKLSLLCASARVLVSSKTEEMQNSMKKYAVDKNGTPCHYRPVTGRYPGINIMNTKSRQCVGPKHTASSHKVRAPIHTHA